MWTCLLIHTFNQLTLYSCLSALIIQQLLFVFVNSSTETWIYVLNNVQAKTSLKFGSVKDLIIYLLCTAIDSLSSTKPGILSSFLFFFVFKATVHIYVLSWQIAPVPPGCNTWVIPRYWNLGLPWENQIFNLIFNELRIGLFVNLLGSFPTQNFIMFK